MDSFELRGNRTCQCSSGRRPDWRPGCSPNSGRQSSVGCCDRDSGEESRERARREGAEASQHHQWSQPHRFRDTRNSLRLFASNRCPQDARAGAPATPILPEARKSRRRHPALRSGHRGRSINCGSIAVVATAALWVRGAPHLRAKNVSYVVPPRSISTSKATMGGDATCSCPFREKSYSQAAS
jgi:hypothetical protein